MKTQVEKVRLSFKCPISTAKLIDCGPNKFCTSCNKTVVDFRNQDYNQLIGGINKDTCGIFSTSQTEHFPKKSSFKRILVTTLITLGLTGFAENLLAQNDTVNTKKSNHGIEDSEEMIFGMIYETMPTYKHGGDLGLIEFLKENLKYPADSSQGRVYVQFTIDTLGQVVEPKILRGISDSADNEALRIVKMLEFHPATQRGKKIEAVYNLPIHFSMESTEKNKRK